MCDIVVYFTNFKKIFTKLYLRIYFGKKFKTYIFLDFIIQLIISPVWQIKLHQN